MLRYRSLDRRSAFLVLASAGMLLAFGAPPSARAAANAGFGVPVRALPGLRVPVSVRTPSDRPLANGDAFNYSVTKTKTVSVPGKPPKKTTLTGTNATIVKAPVMFQTASGATYGFRDTQNVDGSRSAVNTQTGYNDQNLTFALPIVKRTNT